MWAIHDAKYNLVNDSKSMTNESAVLAASPAMTYFVDELFFMLSYCKNWFQTTKNIHVAVSLI